jgi:glycogen operon protein
MTEEGWGSPFGRSIAVYLNGQGIPDHDSRGARVHDDSFLLCFSAHHEPIDFRVPAVEYARTWAVVIDTQDAAPVTPARVVAANGTVTVGPRAMLVLCRAS